MIRKLLFFLLFFCAACLTVLAQDAPESDSLEEMVEPAASDAEPVENEDSVSQNRYRELMQAITDTQYAVVPVPSGTFGNEEQAEKQARSFDFTEKIPKPKEDKKPRKVEKEEPSFDFMAWMPVLKYLLIGILVLVLAYLVYRLVIVGNGQSNQTNETLISWETDPDKIAFEQLEAWLQKALAEQQFAYAVRVLFLMVLKDFSKREIIIWKRNKTNRDYLFEIRERELARSFRQMAHAFDASRYGNYQVNRQAFDLVQAEFNRIQIILKPQQPA